ncbi:hypothetical protein [Arthrobacter sp. B0490]|uniref:hypothetical protein n=1 Tax=Arthrobacter sp. B0490 TaxID=2058891 RepID=UPI000CE50977|nr:hypothetical protein [Arthrobacter sp. B0490]
MSRAHRVLAGPMAVAVTLALLTGCGSGTTTDTSGSTSTSSASGTGSDSPQEQAGSERICDAATAHTSAVSEFEDTLTPEVTIEQLRSARDKIVSTYTELDQAAADVAADRWVAVEAAERKLEKAVDDIPDQATVREAVESLRNEASDLKVAVGDLVKGVTC